MPPNSMEPMTVTVGDARRMIGLGKTKTYELLASGELRSTQIGKRRLVFVASIKELLEKGSRQADPDPAQ